MRIADVRSKMPQNPNPKRRYKRRKLKKISKIILHCTDGDFSLMGIAKYDVTPRPDHHISPKGCPGFTYHYFIEKDGLIKFTMDHELITWHAGKFNGNSVAVCMRYRSTDNPNPPPKEQLTAAYTLLTKLCLDLCIDPDNILGHRELPGTGYNMVNGVKKLRKACPGMLVNMDKVRYIVACAMQKILSSLGHYTGKIDGVFGKKSEAALE